MIRFTHWLVGIVLSLTPALGQATLITITEDNLQMDASETFINFPGTPGESESFSGTTWSDDSHTITAEQDTVPIGDYDSETGAAITAASHYGSYVEYSMLISNGCLGSCISPEGQLLGTASLSSHWVFSVTGGDTEFTIGGVNYNDYADTNFQLVDLTINAFIVSSPLSGYLDATYTLLEDHEYAYSFDALMVSTGDPDPNPVFYFGFNNASVVAVVPEPSTLSMFTIGLIILAWRTRRFGIHRRFDNHTSKDIV